ncbi:MAG: SAM-dependent chlorinase/fluorinase [Zetaproteobacteria bacterium]|nr:SAM-dependent chlorinase/fluorinase [Zetaproteobacteria bacterium]
MNKVITITTDFGLQDEYVGVMKGVILNRLPGATIVDLCHSIARQNICQAAMLIGTAYQYFPKGTIHVVVVDPGVGSERRLLLLSADNHLFLAPDNGVLTPLIEHADYEAARLIDCPEHYITPVSATFHGRDIMAPVAAQLAGGMLPEEVGPRLRRDELITVQVARAAVSRDQQKITGEIVAIDHFGNLLTNITDKALYNLLQSQDLSGLQIMVRNITIKGLQKAYTQAAPGKLLAIVGSRGFIEIAVNKGSAATNLDAETGDKVVVTSSEPTGSQ